MVDIILFWYLHPLVSVGSGKASQVHGKREPDPQIFRDAVALDNAVEGLLAIGGKNLDQPAVAHGVGVGVVSPDIDGRAGRPVAEEKATRDTSASAPSETQREICWEHEVEGVMG